jgi:hypothetical protein
VGILKCACQAPADFISVDHPHPEPRTGDVAADGNVSESGDVGGGSGEEISFLFHSPIALKSACTEIGPERLVKHRTSRGVRTAPDGP